MSEFSPFYFFMQTAFTKSLNILHPIIMAPMFLVSNEAMIQSAMRCGIMGTFPTLNYRRDGELERVLTQLRSFKQNQPGSYGVNLIVQKTNPLYEKHLEICSALQVPFYITSLGNPKQVVEKAHAYGASVYCDVTNIEHAKKCVDMGCDGFIAVTQGAGGHAGPYPLSILLPALQKQFPKIPVIAAGGIATGGAILSAIAAGAAGVSIGTRYIASEEASVSKEYKQGVVDSGMEDIVLTEKLSGTPCNVINTPYAQKIGYRQNFFERLLSNNSTTKKYFKMLVQVRGMKKLEEAIKPGNYNNLWSAGQTVEMIDDILPCDAITERLMAEMMAAKKELDTLF
jgi:nitronate monooxygenase